MTSHDMTTGANRNAASESLDALIDLHTQSVDTHRGFDKMVEKAEPSFRPVVDRFLALHTRHVARLDRMVREMGAVPDAAGSFMGTVNRAVVTMRAAFDAIDSDTMAQIRSGEEYVIAAFDRALATSLPQGHMAALSEMRAELASLLASSPPAT
jgi:uncharacterized protein (TIGR02284 family)